MTLTLEQALSAARGIHESAERGSCKGIATDAAHVIQFLESLLPKSITSPMTLTLGALNTLSSIIAAPSLFTTTKEMFIAGRLLAQTIGDNSYRGSQADGQAVAAHIQKTKDVQFSDMEADVLKTAIKTAVGKGLVGCTPQMFELLNAFDIKE